MAILQKTHTERTPTTPRSQSLKKRAQTPTPLLAGVKALKSARNPTPLLRYCVVADLRALRLLVYFVRSRKSLSRARTKGVSALRADTPCVLRSLGLLRSLST